MLLSKAWVDGAAAGHRGEAVAEALDSNLELDESAVAAALAGKVKPRVSVQDVLRGIAARVGATGGATGKSATRLEIATHIKVAADEVRREGAPPDGPLGKAIELGYVEQHPAYKGIGLNVVGKRAVDFVALPNARRALAQPARCRGRSARPM